ncbi:hypothetical protein CC86DRAFT_380889 [Ophiobolus disseminans]|uniref:Uncharacterized protein n=1 Tax=Ophiobolus disseminans TaxID=1469910 RepID=A0A6A7A436_9PLEO|nr:hypothetical protein CC86DRAFT_380889 [Ophiobolus disseminans]
MPKTYQPFRFLDLPKELRDDLRTLSSQDSLPCYQPRCRPFFRERIHGADKPPTRVESALRRSPVAHSLSDQRRSQHRFAAPIDGTEGRTGPLDTSGGGLQKVEPETGSVFLQFEPELRLKRGCKESTAYRTLRAQPHSQQSAMLRAYCTGH